MGSLSISASVIMQLDISFPLEMGIIGDNHLLRRHNAAGPGRLKVSFFKNGIELATPEQTDI